MPRVIVVRDENSFEMVRRGLSFFKKPSKRKIVVKPNLITIEPPPTTTPLDTVEALVQYYVEKGYEVIIAEGSGWCDTFEAYERLGFTRLAEKYGVRLVDLNNDEFEVIENPNALFLKKFELPLTLKNAYIISVPILKEHSITGVTLSLKNMLGATLGEKGRIARKGRFHRRLDESIVDINMYIKPSLAVIDGRIAGIGGELRAKPKKLNIMIFSEDLVAADAVATKFLGKDPAKITHIMLAEKAGLGIADLNRIEIVEIALNRNLV